MYIVILDTEDYKNAKSNFVLFVAINMNKIALRSSLSSFMAAQIHPHTRSNDLDIESYVFAKTEPFLGIVHLGVVCSISDCIDSYFRIR